VVLKGGLIEKKPNTSSFVQLSDGSRYIEPNVVELIPPLFKYCTRNAYGGDSYYCIQLYRILFRSANQHNRKRRYFEKVTEHSTNSIGEDIQYNVKNLMSDKESESTIIDICQRTEKVCEELINDTHPLRKKFLEETKK